MPISVEIGADSVSRETTQGSHVPAGMIRVPGGAFRMGSEGGSDAERPVHLVDVDEFYLDASLVSNGDFARFVNETGYLTSAELRSGKESATWRTYNTDSRRDHPVILVSWFDAVAYTRWCGKFLPAEAQWEKAARGGIADGVYPWGTGGPTADVTNWMRVGEKGNAPPTVPVTQCEPNALGLHDMAGNVWQWCADWYGEDYYSNSETHNPRGPLSGQYRVRRGGAWNVREAFRLRCANRGAMAPESSWPNVGFRCAWAAGTSSVGNGDI